MSPRRHHYGTYDTQTPPGHSYVVDATGTIIRNDEGKEVYEFMRRVMWNAFRYDLLTTWPNVSRERKEYVCIVIRDEYPQPSSEYEFNETLLIQEMGTIMGHRRLEACDRYKEGKSKPSWCDDEIWELIKQERDGQPNKFAQQTEARSHQSNSQTSHLGSGGKAAFKRDFVSSQTSHFYIDIVYVLFN